MLNFPLTLAEAELVLRALQLYRRCHNGDTHCAAADLAARLDGLMAAPAVAKVAGVVTEGSGA